MTVRGFIRTADLEEDPLWNDRVRLLLLVQGVGPGQPRRLVIPHELLIADESLDPDTLAGRSFAAEISQDASRNWVVQEITLASRVLRREEG